MISDWIERNPSRATAFGLAGGFLVGLFGVKRVFAAAQFVALVQRSLKRDNDFY